MSSATDTDAKGDGGHNLAVGLNPHDQERLNIMIRTLQGQRGIDLTEVFATVGSAAVAADTLRGMGYTVRHNVLAVQVSP